MTSDEELYQELAAYTLQLRDEEFIHQHVIDAYGVQHAGPDSKPIAVVFALVGLYLHLEKGYTGKQVQRAHMVMAQQRDSSVLPQLPSGRSKISVRDVMSQAPGAARNAMIRRWCEEVWKSWKQSRSEIAMLTRQILHI